MFINTFNTRDATYASRRFSIQRRKLASYWLFHLKREEWKEAFQLSSYILIQMLSLSILDIHYHNLLYLLENQYQRPGSIFGSA